MVKIENIKAVTKDNKFKYAWKIVTTTMLLVVICGCQPSWYNKLGHDMDYMAKGREKFGTISISAPILVESNEDQSSPFDFTLKTGPDDYYKDARSTIQGRMSYLDQFVKESGAGLSVQGDISALSAYSAELKQYEQELAAVEAQNKLRTEARELEAQKVIAALPDDASEEQVLEARARAAEIRAGQDTITVPDHPASQTQPSDITTPPSSKATEKDMTGLLGLLGGTHDLKISNRSAISTAAGDTVTEAIFTLLGNPAKTAQFKDKLMLFGVSMVSVTPGYVTKEGHTGELAVFCDYFYDIARKDLLKEILKVQLSKKECDRDDELIELINKVLRCESTNGWDPNLIPQRYQREFREEFTPFVAAVSPMTDVDALDLSSSIRNQAFAAMQISAALSYVGLTGQAEIFENWARKLEQDTRTRTSYAAVTSFSDGPFFGFRIRPRLKPVKEKTGFLKFPGYELEDQAFPMAVIVGIDTDDLKLAFEHDDNGKLVAYEPTIGFHQTVNWLPNKEVPLRDILFGIHQLNKLRGNVLTETRRLKWLKSHERVVKKTKAIKDANIIGDPNYYFKKYIDNRNQLLKHQTLGKYSLQYLPMKLLVGKPVKKKPTVDDPSKVFECWYDAPGTYVVDGNNFEGQVLGANIGGQSCEVKVVGDKIALITSPGWTPKPDPNTILAEKKIAQAELDIVKVNKKINDAQKIIKDANESLSRNPSDQVAREKKEAAEKDLDAAKSELIIVKANKKIAEAAKKLAMVQTATSKDLQINLITTKGSIKAGFVRFERQAMPVKSKTPSSSKSGSTSKTDPTLTITRNTSGKILTISSKGESKEVDKLIDIVKEGEKAGANVDLKFNASGQMDVKADKKTK